MNEEQEYRLLNRDGVEAWVQSLIAQKGSYCQHLLLKKAKDNDPVAFASYVESEIQRAVNLPPYCGGNRVPSLAGQDGESVVPITAGHMYLMPSKDIMAIYKHWNDIPFDMAADPQFWGSVTLSEIRSKRIMPAWLAVDRGGNEDIATEQLDRAIQHCAADEDSPIPENPKPADRMVRRILRWMMGPGHMRGAPELYGNCSFAKAWWCGYVSFEAAKKKHGPDITIDDALDEIQAFKSVWLEVADWMSGRLRVICEPSVLSGIAQWILKVTKEKPEEKIGSISRAEVQKVIKKLGQLSSWRVLGLESADNIEYAITEFTKQNNSTS